MRASQAKPMTSPYNMIDDITYHLDCEATQQQFCQSFIDEHQLTHHRTWSRRGLLNKLECPMRNSDGMAREQLVELIDNKLKQAQDK